MICCICNKNHNMSKLFFCNNLFTIMIRKYININITEIKKKIKKEIKSIKTKIKYKCDTCNKIMKTSTIYKYHTQNNVCKKINKLNCNKCNKCNKIFTDKRCLIYHIKHNVCINKINEINNNEINNNEIYNQIINNEINNQIIDNVQLNNENNNEIKDNKIYLNKFKKKSIPLPLKRQVWNTYIGEEIGKAKCLCCKLTDITQLSFSCGREYKVFSNLCEGHIIPESKGGKLILDNLKPICQSCNSSMGTNNMHDYIQYFGF